MFRKYKTERSSSNLNKDLSGHRKSERTQENINLQKKPIANPSISAKKNSLDISTFNRITNRDLKWYPHKERKSGFT